LLAFIIRK